MILKKCDTKRIYKFYHRKNIIDLALKIFPISKYERLFVPGDRGGMIYLSIDGIEINKLMPVYLVSKKFNNKIS